MNKTGFIPTADKVLVEPVAVEEKHGTIVLAAATLEKEQLAQQCGIVLALGTTAPLAPEMEGIGVGDMVLCNRYSGMEYPVDGVKYRVYRARDVIGKALRLPDSVVRGHISSTEAFGENQIATAAAA